MSDAGSLRPLIVSVAKMEASVFTLPPVIKPIQAEMIEVAFAIVCVADKTFIANEIIRDEIVKELDAHKSDEELMTDAAKIAGEFVLNKSDVTLESFAVRRQRRLVAGDEDFFARDTVVLSRGFLGRLMDKEELEAENVKWPPERAAITVEGEVTLLMPHHRLYDSNNFALLFNGKTLTRA